MTAKNDTRDHAILEHLGRYGMSIRPVIEKCFFHGRSCDNVMRRLIKEERVTERRRCLENNRTYYQLTAKEVERLGFPEGRDRRIKSNLHFKLGLLWFCCMAEIPRHLLRRDEVEKCLSQELTGRDSFCIEFDPKIKTDGKSGKRKMLRIYRLQAESRVEKAVDWVEKHIRLAQQEKSTSAIMLKKRYGLAIAIDDPTPQHEKLKELTKRLREKQFRRSAHIRVGIAPSPTTLEAELRSRKEKMNVEAEKIASPTPQRQELLDTTNGTQTPTCDLSAQSRVDGQPREAASD